MEYIRVVAPFFALLMAQLHSITIKLGEQPRGLLTPFGQSVIPSAAPQRLFFYNAGSFSSAS